MVFVSAFREIFVFRYESGKMIYFSQKMVENEQKGSVRRNSKISRDTKAKILGLDSKGAIANFGFPERIRIKQVADKET
jgi:hypothetical protein